jgi:YD repeat-containing protein
VSLLDCASPAEVLPIPYGEMPQAGGGATGEYVAGATDLGVPALGGALSVARTYRSLDAITGRGGPFGPGWHWTYSTTAVAHADGSVSIIEASGRRSVFLKSGASWTAGPGVNATLAAGQGGGWVLTRHNQSVWTFDATGKLTSIADRNGNAHTLTYTAGRLTAVTAPGGRALAITNDGQGRITRIDAPGGLYAAYTYDPNGNLSTARDGSGATTTYNHDGRRQLLGWADGRGVIAAINTYGTQGRVVEESRGWACVPPGGFCTWTAEGGTRMYAYHYSSP